MDKELFLKGMQELLEVAKAGGDKIRKKDILSYFEGMDITDEIEAMLCDYFVEAGVRVEGYDRIPKKEQPEEETEPGVIRFYEEELAERGESDPETVRDLIVRLVSGEDVRNELIESLLTDVSLTAKKYTGRGVLLGDLVQEGNMGLIEAVYELDEKDPRKAEEFLKASAEAAIKAAVSEQTNADSMGEQMAVKANRLDEAARYLAKDLGREATAKELADELSMTEEEVKEIMKMSLDAISVVETDITQK
ncbi:sigma-70 domain-containing protein [Anaerostipes sp.]|uniref:sigma-70 domain-containing protein n=1 Tax=Anaerostipes sp. TaxID=1872530 RepID=UPI0025C00FA5|nr:sigma-70 domain-containing protein [Anaerostipes sp.]MBS7008360.1 hypothetical protein [Anaerostipes sp.]